jgi:hypothetical protein
MAAKRNYSAEHARRLARARGRGFTSYAQQRKSPRVLGSLSDLGRLPEAARDVRSQALSAVEIARSEGVTVERGAARVGLPMDAVRYYASEALRATNGDVTWPRPADRLLRPRPLVVRTPTGPKAVFVPVRGSRAAAQAWQAFRIQWGYVHNQASETDLARLEGLRVGGFDVETDTDTLLDFARSGELDFEEAYRAVVA